MSLLENQLIAASLLGDNIQAEPHFQVPFPIQEIHETAMRAAVNFKHCEATLLEAIMEVNKKKAYRYFNCGSLFDYCVRRLKLDPGVVYGFTAVAAKSMAVPELRDKIKEGVLSVSTAKRFTSVLTPENKDEWFEKAETLTVNKLEKEVARANPKAEVKERASYLKSTRVKLELGLSEDLMLELRRVQDLESKRKKRSVTLEETLAALTSLYLTKNDPNQRAKRAKIRGNKANLEQSKSQQTTPKRSENSSVWKGTKRKPLPAKCEHEVYLRDEGRCQFIYAETGSKCLKSRFTEIHHLKFII